MALKCIIYTYAYITMKCKMLALITKSSFEINYDSLKIPKALAEKLISPT